MYLLNGLFGVSIWTCLERFLSEKGVLTLLAWVICCMTGKQSLFDCLFVLGGTVLSILISSWNVIV